MAITALDHHETGYRLEHAYWLARAAKLAYSDESAIREAVGEWGFDRFRFLEGTPVTPLPIDHTQAFVAASDSMIIVAFRGTEPTQIRDWLTDANAPAGPGPDRRGLVHLGFSQALASVHPALLATLEEFRDNDQTLWFTGHSLGGALAQLAAAWLYFEDPNLLADGIYTFGQPRTCDRELATAYDGAIRARTHRFVNNNDVVPELPPEPFYRHVERVRYFDSQGRLQERTTLLGGAVDRLRGHTADPLSPGADALRDHPINRYLECLEKNLA
ncbi:lipase family protein [Actinoalloteichus caeruleus]|uniref:Triacylglycerol lipase n=1 Tax=Actinoalloteichus caeruleus DSM 43889 TaxID=1120930 RepID=A0ABT1JH04_ACTCY|nr:lipase family protein [Actinoalloteichus caeruleus]MCP2331061.1 triacylglycerol lipase [Actinoalloteichus caeruleus DSM 43889]